MTLPVHRPLSDPEFDVFLSHDSRDKPEVELLAKRLVEEAKLRPFLDRWHLVPGKPLQEGLADALGKSTTAALFFGPHGKGPWFNEEMQVIVDRAARERDEFRAIPVLLPGAEAEEVQTFLRQRLWVDFRAGMDDEQAFKNLVAGITGAPAEVEGYELPDEPAPYRGLNYFGAEQSDFFFGRDTEIRRLAKKLGERRFVAVVGASGSGKSSLVRAGLETDVAEQVVPGIGAWKTVTVLPGGTPLRSLAEGLAHELPASERLKLVDDLVERLTERDDGLATAISTLFADSGETLLLVVDQFEEVFTHAHSKAATERFIANLVAAVASGGERLRIVVTLRADFMSHALEFPALLELLESSSLLIGELDENALREAIVFPARRVGAYFEKGVVRALLGDVKKQPGSLPLLQHALLELWRARRGPWLTLEAYDASGGVSGALQHRADKVFESLSQEERAIARSVFLRLTTLGEGTNDTRRRVEREELYLDSSDRHRETIDRVVEALSAGRARLVTVGEDTVEVTHEALIQEWPRLRYWLETNREELRLHRRLTEAAEEWEENGRDPGYLYRSGRLEEAEAWARSGEGALNPLEREFLDESLAQRTAEDDRETARLQRLRRLVGLLAAASIAATVTSWWAIRSTGRAEAKTVEAQNERNGALRAQSLRLARLANEQTTLGDAATAILLALAALPADIADPDRPYVAETETALHDAVSALRERKVMRGHEGPIEHVAYSPDGARIVTSSRDGTARVWDSAGQELHVLGAVANREPGEPFPRSVWVNGAAFSPDGDRIVTAGGDGTARLWDDKGRELAVFTHATSVLEVEFDTDGDRILTTSTGGAAWVWGEGPEPIAELPHRGDDVCAVFSPDGGRIITGGGIEPAQLWDGDWTQPKPLDHEIYSWDVAFSPDGSHFVTGRDGFANLWDGEGESAVPLEGLDEEVHVVAFSPDGSKILAVSFDDAHVWTDGGDKITVLSHAKRVEHAAFSPDSERVITASGNAARIWNLEGEVLAAFVGHEDRINRAMFSPDGSHVVTASDDGTARMWRVRGPELAILGDPSYYVHRAAFSPDSTRIATVGGNTVRLWHADGTRLGRMEHDHSVVDVAFSPDGERIVTTSRDVNARIWTGDDREPISLNHGAMEVGKARFSPDGSLVVTASSSAWIWRSDGKSEPLELRHDKWVRQAEFSPDGSRIATRTTDGVAMLWGVSGEGPIELDHGTSVRHVAFGPGGQRVITVSDDKTARLWGVNGEPLAEMIGHEDGLEYAAFSPDGRLVVTASDDWTARLWDLEGNELAVLDGHDDHVFYAAFSPDGTRIATGSDDHTARIWDLDGNQRAILRGHTDSVTRVEFSSDGKRLLTASEDGTARVSRVFSTQELIEHARAIAPRSLTADQREQFYLPIELSAEGPIRED